jgi:hypothetical protein
MTVRADLTKTLNPGVQVLGVFGTNLQALTLAWRSSYNGAQAARRFPARRVGGEIDNDRIDSSINPARTRSAVR